MHIRHCFGTRNCRMRIQRLPFPDWDTYSGIKCLSEQMIKHQNDKGKKVLIILTGEKKYILQLYFLANSYFA